MRMGWCLVVVVWALVGIPSARAEGGSTNDLRQSPPYPRLALGVTPGIGLRFGIYCPTPTSDAVGCPTAGALAAVRLSPRWQITSAWAVGLSGGPSFLLGSPDQTSTTWWALQVEGRYYPEGQGPAASWISASIGPAVAVDFVSAHRVDTGELRPSLTYKNYAPSASVAVGLDTEVTGWLAVGPELRGIFFGFNTDRNTGGPAYQPQYGLLLGLTVTGLGPTR